MVGLGLVAACIATPIACGKSNDDPAEGIADAGAWTPARLFPARRGQSVIRCRDRNRALPDYQPLGNLYWGDLHAHTSYSLDSYAASNRNDPKDAYAFARGTPVPIGTGQ